MCGIFGIIHFDGTPVSVNTLSHMGNRMVHRGPDDDGYLIRDTVGIGMRRLSIIDLVGGQQPISNENSDIHIVLNGEIYNYLELRAELVERGHNFSTNSDVEVVLHLYEEMGQSCLERINGMFALAIYDERSELLWLARDRLGIKPLFYQQLDNGVVFSSDLGSIASLTDAQLDIASMFAYMGNSYVPEPHTIYKDIFKLECATHMSASRGVVKRSTYWQPTCKDTWNGSVEDAAEELEELLLDAANLQLRSDVPVGVFLSGGVDSSAVAAFAAQVNGVEAVNTFTIDYLGKNGEDSNYAEKVAQHIGSKHECIPVSVDDQLTSLEELIVKIDEPMSDSAIVPTYILSREAKKRGIKVLLSGAGGDEVFGGYSRHFPERVGSAAWIAHRSWVRLPFRLAVASSRPHWNRRFSNPARNYAVMVSGANLEFLYQVFPDHSDYDDLLDQIDQNFSRARSGNVLERMKLDLDNYLPNNILSLTDKATMAASVEGRVPLIDHRIVEFAYSLPSSINLLNGYEKGLFKKVLQKYLPVPVLTRGKEGFNAPMAEWSTRIALEVDHAMKNIHPLLEQHLNIHVIDEWLLNSRKRYFASESLYSIYMLNRWLWSHH